MNIIVRIPDELAMRLGLTGADLERQALEALVLETYRAGRMTTDDLREALGLDASGQAEAFLKAHGMLEPSAVVDVDGQGKISGDDMVTVSAKEYARLKRRDRQVHRVEDLPEDIIDRIARAEMDPRHDHLNEPSRLGTVTLPEPEPGLVIRYAYLWHREFLEGREDGVKDRPCAIVVTTRNDDDGRTRVWVIPISHAVPDDPTAAIELPPAVKRHLSLDSERSWAILSETNDFLWPGPDLRRVGSESGASPAYGFLPPNFFAALRKKMSSIIKDRRKLKHVHRTE